MILKVGLFAWSVTVQCEKMIDVPVVHTTNSSITRAHKSENSNTIVQRDNDDVSVSRQRLAVVDPERISTAVEPPAIYPHL